MSAIFSITRHELRRMFRSPFAWVVLAVVQFILAQLFLKYWEIFELKGAEYASVGITEIVVSGLYQTAAMVMLMVAPFITMRGFSEERRTGTMQLLLSSPISVTQLVFGKYFAVLGFFLLLLFMISLMPLSLGLGTQLDYWQIGSSVVGLTLLLAAFSAIGLFLTTLTSSTAVAAVSTFGVLFLLWIISLAGNSGSEQVASVLNYLSLLTHYNHLLNGLFNTADVFYYLIVITIFLALSIWRLDSERML